MKGKYKYRYRYSIMVIILLILCSSCVLYTSCGDGENAGQGKKASENSVKPVPIDAINTSVGKSINIPDFKDWLTKLTDKEKQDLSNKLHMYNTSEKIDIDLGVGFSRGNINSHYRIVEFFEFNCLHCRSLSRILDTLLKMGNNDFYVESRIFPLDIECNPKVPKEYPGNGNGSCELAQAAICAGEQDLFFEFKKSLFEGIALPYKERIELAVEDMEKFSKENNKSFDRNKYDKCVLNKSLYKDQHQDVKDGIELGINGTPFLVWNGKRLSIDEIVIIAMLLSYSNPNHPLFKEILPKPNH